MAPTIAVDSAGVPAVAWAASDGADAEIWISRRVAGRWSAPFPLSNNDVPDITPSLAVAGDRLLVAWITYARNGYLPQARIGQADRWGAVATLDDGPGSRALAVALDGTPAVFWRRLDDSAAGGTITGRRLGASGWGPSVDLTAAAGSPFSLASSSDGGVVLTWTRPNGTLGTLEGRGSSGADAWEALFSAATRSGEPRLEPPLPRPAAGETSIDPDVGGIPALYAAFGDSITNGVLMDPDRRESEGYRGPLESLLRGFFGFGTVLNAGRDGESTADGVGRIGTVVRALNPDVVLIMEGTNDVFADIDESVIAFNLQRIIERARGEKPDILPFLAQLPPRFDPSFGFEGSFNESVDLLNALLVPIAAEIGVPLVDVNTALENQPDLWSDPLHPSVAGYQVMGETWYDSIKPVALDASNRGDIDGSGRTDGVDLVRLALAFGAIVGEDRYNAVADINGDGIVDGFDLNVLAESFGRTHSGPGS
jgi:lysophospholipase L1-like esterase